jgi:hypothetical protein
VAGPLPVVGPTGAGWSRRARGYAAGMSVLLIILIAAAVVGVVVVLAIAMIDR